MNDPKGSVWRKWDMHIHTPASFHWKGQRFPTMKQEECESSLKSIVDKMAAGDIAAYCIVDYWTFDGYIKLKAYMDLDHFYPKSLHPYFALSFFNLILIMDEPAASYFEEGLAINSILSIAEEEIPLR